MTHTTDADGRLFLDRSGELFAYVLEFLRAGALPAQSVLENVRIPLLEEAAFFGVEHLCHRLSGVFDLRHEDRQLGAMKHMRFVERHVESQLVDRGLTMIARSEGFQSWEEIKRNEKGERERRELSVFFLRGPRGGPFGTWTRRCTEDCTAGGQPDHPHLFIVIGGRVEDKGEGNIYVSGPNLKLPPVIRRPPEVFVNHLMLEQHTLRHDTDTRQVTEVFTEKGRELRAV